MNKFKKYFLIVSLLIPMLVVSSLSNEVMKKHVIGSGSMIKSLNAASQTQLYGTFGQTAVGKFQLHGTADAGTMYLGFWGKGDAPVDVNDNNIVGNQSLKNYPNPVTSTTTIQFELPGAAEVSLKIYDNSGRLMKTINGGYFSQGIQKIEYNATDNNGMKLLSGSYMYELIATPSNMSGVGAFDAITLRNVMIIAR